MQYTDKAHSNYQVSYRPAAASTRYRKLTKPGVWMMRHRIAFFFLALASVAPAQSLYNGHYYQVVVNNHISWTTAGTNAAGMTFSGVQGHLATITSAGENTFVNTLMGVGPNWIGGYQVPLSSEPAGGWTWITGEPWSFTNWGPGEPNNDFGIEDRLVMGTVEPGISSWGDLPDDGGFAAIRGYIVEYEPVPEPLSILALAAGITAIVGRRRRIQA
jgi:hypothetical protein